MAKKTSRQRSSGDLARRPPSLPRTMEPSTALILGGAHVMHGAVQAGGQVASAAIETTGRVLEASIKSFSDCFCSFMDYLREREITARVLAQEREITARVVAQEEAATERVRLWASAVIAEAEARTEEVKVHASLVLATVKDRQAQREAKCDVITKFMDAYQRWQRMLDDALASRAKRMPLDERERLQSHIDLMLQRAREMEQTIASITMTL